MADFRGYVTAAGQTFEALAKQMGYPVTIGFIEVGDGKLPDSESPIDRTQLVHKLKQFPAIVEQDAKNPGQWVATCYIPADDAINGAGYFIREIGCKLINQGNGVLYAYRRVSDDWKPVITSGEAKSFIYKLRFIPSNGELLTPTIDPSVVLVDKEELARVMNAHIESRNHPYATTQDKGMVKVSSQSEIDENDASPGDPSVLKTAHLWSWAENSIGKVSFTFSIWKRALSESGIDLFGKFGHELELSYPNQAVLNKEGTAAFCWTGSFPKRVGKDESPSSQGWKDVTTGSLRHDLSLDSGAGLIGGVAIPAADKRFAGGMNEASQDNKPQIKSIIDSGETVRLKRGTYEATGPVSTSNGKRVCIEGEGLDTTIKLSGKGGMLSVTKAVSAAIRKMRFDMTQPSSLDTTHGLIFIEQPDLTVEKVLLMGLTGVGTGIISYSQGDVQVPYSTIRDVRVRGNRGESSNTNGVLLEDSVYSVMNNIDASGFAAFAIELKNLSEYNRTSDSVARNSNGGLYYGSGQIDRYPRYNVASNIISKSCDFGYVPGRGEFNTLSGYFCDAEGAESSVPEGVRYDGHDNLTVGMSYRAAVNGVAVRHNGEAYNNFTSVKYSAGSGTNNKVVVNALGARRNVTEVLHPGGEYENISSLVGDLSGQAMSGRGSNPVYCHATGEYYGVFGPGWKWVHAKSGGSRNSAHKWRFESIGDSFASVSTDGTGLAGFNVNNPNGNRNLLWNEVGGYWGLDGSDFGLRMYSSTLRPTSDNQMDFGTATYRGRTAYFGTGVINTSDADEKTAPEIISEQLLDAADSIEIILFKWLASIKEKGEDEARWHFGAIAQQVKEAFDSHGVDGFDYGLLCYDEWQDQYEDVFDDVTGKYGTTSTLYIGQRLVQEAGSRWGLRPDQCHWLLHAASRRKIEKADKEIQDVKSMLIGIESRLKSAGI